MADNDVIPEIAYENALALVFDSISLARKGLRLNPSKEEERKLNKTLLRLEVERADLEAMLDALADDDPVGVAPPTQAQVDEIAALTGEVEGLTRANLTAAGALSAASKVLALAVAVAGG